MAVHVPVEPPAERVVILGGAGFIGARLADLLQGAGHAVCIGDLRESSAFPQLWKICDVRQATSVRELLEGATVLINLAAEHRDDVRPISRYRETNVEGARQVCIAAREAGVQRIVFTSSVAVYGFQPYPVDEHGPFAPFNAYGRTKLEAEEVYRAWAQEDAARTLVIVRPTVVFGEGNRGNVYNLLRQIASVRFHMVGSGKNVKSMAYVGNVAAFLKHACSFGPGLQIFNYVDGPDMSVSELVAHIYRCLGRSQKPVGIPKFVALGAGYGLDIAAKLSGRTFPISAVRIRKFCETTQFRADRVRQTAFTPPYSLGDALERTIRAEFGVQ
ncbi:MAG: NAD-dependent epimerase/dehydratase family protein [Acidobacteriaceae bacterium]